MSSLRCCEYRELEGKTIRRVRWSNDLDWHDLSIDFTDENARVFQVQSGPSRGRRVVRLQKWQPKNPRTLVGTPVRFASQAIGGQMNAEEDNHGGGWSQVSPRATQLLSVPLD